MFPYESKTQPSHTNFFSSVEFECAQLSVFNSFNLDALS